jgi:hypothetical protein
VVVVVGCVGVWVVVVVARVAGRMVVVVRVGRRVVVVVVVVVVGRIGTPVVVVRAPGLFGWVVGGYAEAAAAKAEEITYPVRVAGVVGGAGAATVETVESGTRDGVATYPVWTLHTSSPAHNPPAAMHTTPKTARDVLMVSPSGGCPLDRYSCHRLRCVNGGHSYSSFEFARVRRQATSAPRPSQGPVMLAASPQTSRRGALRSDCPLCSDRDVWVD